MANLIPIGQLQAAGDLTTATLVARETATQAEVDSRIQAQVGPLVADAVASDPTVANAAAAAATTYAGAAGKRDALGAFGALADTIQVVNVIPNPMGATSTAGWDRTGGTVVTSLPTGGKDGGPAVTTTVTTAASFTFGYQDAPITGGEWWVFGLDAAAFTVAPKPVVKFDVRFYNASGTQVGIESRTVTMTSGQWTQQQFAVLTPATAVRARIIMLYVSGIANGDTFRAAGATAHKGKDFYGTISGLRADASWQSTPHGSPSILTVPAPRGFDVVVVGGSEVGVIAAVRAARMGARVALVSESERLGGVTGWSLTATDIVPEYTPGVIWWGLTGEYFSRVVAKGGQVRLGRPRATNDRWYRLGGTGRPSWWIQPFEEMVDEAGVEVIRNAPLRRVIREGSRVDRVVVGDQTIIGKVFVEATPTADLLRMAGIPTRVGRDATATFGEPDAGVLTPKSLGIDPYVIPGDPASGLIYGVGNGAPGTVGAADPDHMMSSGIRTWVSRSSSRRVPWPEPVNYDPSKYEMIARYWALDPAKYEGANMYEALDRTFTTYDLGDILEFDLNQKLWPCALPEPALWREYVDATPERRQEITDLARDYLFGLVKFIRTSTDPRVPVNLRAALEAFGPTIDEMSAYGGVSPIVYLREARRLAGAYTLTQVNALTRQDTASAKTYIGWMAYLFDSKAVRTLVVNGIAHSEGEFYGQNSGEVYGAPIPYGVLTPVPADATNVLAPSAPSVSRHTWLAVRAIPVLLNLADSAGAAAAIAALRGVSVQDVQAEEIRNNTGQLQPPPGSLILQTAGLQDSGEVDTGAWTKVTGTDARWPGPSAGEFWEAPAGEPTTFRFTPYLASPGIYRVQLLYPAQATYERGAATPVPRPTDTTVRIVHSDGVTERVINQQYPVGAGGAWETVGDFHLPYGTVGNTSAYIEIDASLATSGKAVAGMVAFTRIG